MWRRCRAPLPLRPRRRRRPPPPAVPTSPPPPRRLTTVAASALPPPGLPTTPTVHTLLIPSVNRSPTSRRYAASAGTGLTVYVTGRDLRLGWTDPMATAAPAPADGGGDGGGGEGGKGGETGGTAVHAATLSGHAVPVVDVEVMASTLDDPLHVVGSADEQGVVILWFLKLGAPTPSGERGGITLARKYSMYTVRRVREAYYSRLRLGGRPGGGVLLLVPNDGGGGRLIVFEATLGSGVGGVNLRVTEGGDSSLDTGGRESITSDASNGRGSDVDADGVDVEEVVGAGAASREGDVVAQVSGEAVQA
ncbi:hypothetical protein MMPV_006309 [Pyropia vietnamensis]